jgi:hypothetical protein
LSRKSKASPGQQKLGRAQSNITTRIQQLEEELDVELFVRGNKKMALSCAGKQFLDYALRILSLGEEAKQALHPSNPPGACAWGDGSDRRQPANSPSSTVSRDLSAGRADVAYPAYAAVDRAGAACRPRLRAGESAAERRR